MKRNYGNKITLSGLCLLLLSACSGGTGGSLEAPQEEGMDAKFPAPLAGSSAGDSQKLISCGIAYKLKVDAFKANCVQAQAMEHFIESREKPLPNL